MAWTPKTFKPDAAPTGAPSATWTPKTFKADAPAPAAEPQVSPERTLADAYAATTTLGHADELGAGFQANLSILANKFPKLAEALGMEGRYKMDPTEIYKEARTENRHLRKLGSEQNPWTSALGTGLGVGASVLALPTIGTGLAGAATTGMAYGTLAGLGASEADLLGAAEGKKDMAQEAAQLVLDGSVGGLGGAAFGAGGHALVKGAGRAASWVGGKLQTLARRRAADVAHPMLKDARILGQEGIDEMGEELLKRGAVRFGDSAESLANRLGPIREKAGQEVGDAVAGLDASRAQQGIVGLDRAALVAKLRREVLAPLQRFPAQRGIAQRIAEEIDQIEAFEAGKPLTYGAMEALKRSMDDLAKFDQATPAPVTRAFQHLRGALGGHTEDAARAMDPARAAQFTAAKESFGNLAPAEKIASDYAKRMQANRTVSPSDYGVGAAVGVAQNSGPSGLIAALAHKLVRERGSSMTAVTADKMARLLLGPRGVQMAKAAVRSRPQMFPELAVAAAKGDDALEMVHGLLLKHSPDYAGRMASVAEAEAR